MGWPRQSSGPGGHDTTSWPPCPACRCSSFSTGGGAAGVAVACLRGDMTLQDSAPEALSDLALAQLRQKVQVLEDPACTRAYPERYGARLVARMHSGAERVIEVQTAKGDPENPMSQTELEVKAQRLMQAAGVSAQAGDRLVHSTLALAHGGSFKDFSEALTHALLLSA